VVSQPKILVSVLLQHLNLRNWGYVSPLLHGRYPACLSLPKISDAKVRFRLIERITAFAIQVKAMDKQSLLLVSVGVSLLSVLMGYSAISWRSPWIGLFAGFLGSRFGSVWVKLL
jgi:hypothetical protein